MTWPRSPSATFDSLFLADGPAVRADPEFRPASALEPAILLTALPSGLRAFADHVIPIFRRRGLFRTGYSGQTLREHYGLPRPDSQFTVTRPRGVPVPVP